MMSMAEVISMAMARLLVVILKVRGRCSRTYNYAVGSREKIDVEEQVQLFFWVESSLLLVRMMVLTLMKSMVTVLKLE